MSTSDRICLPLRVCAWWICLVKLRAMLIYTAEQKCNTIWSGHWLTLAAFVSFTEVNGNIGNSLCDCFDRHWLIVIECVILSLNTGMINENTSVSNDATHGACTVSIDLNQLLTVTSRNLQLWRLQLLLNAENHTLICLHSDRCGTELRETKWVNQEMVESSGCWMWDSLPWWPWLRTQSGRYVPQARMCWHHDRSVPCYNIIRVRLQLRLSVSVPL